jgi:very-short-patch-repair endonuclease
MDLAQLATSQYGVVSRAQALDHLSPDSVRWKLSHRVWQRVHPGVYAVHTQQLDWVARASAALLFYGEGAALSLESAAFWWGLDSRQPLVVHVDVPIGTQRGKRTFVKVRRRRRLETKRRKKLLVTSPAFTVIDLGDVATADREDAVAVAARAVQRRKVTAADLVAELGKRRTHRHRRALELSLGIVADGAESLLEVDFVTRVLRAHGLAEMRMAVPDHVGGVSIRRDFVDDAHQVVVEVDGRIAHEGRRGADIRRDRSTAARGSVTLRAEWVDVHFEACQLAADIFATQRSRGYQGMLNACGPGCKAAIHLRRSA